MEEKGALQKYKSFDAYSINEALRNLHDVSKLTLHEQEFINNLDSALKKMPRYEGNLVRVIDFSDRVNADELTEHFVNRFVPGKIITVEQYWSTSKQEGYSDTANIKIYIEKSKKGRDISSIGLNENEVLFERNCKYQVISKVHYNDIWNILVREVE